MVVWALWADRTVCAQVQRRERAGCVWETEWQPVRSEDRAAGKEGIPLEIQSHSPQGCNDTYGTYCKNNGQPLKAFSSWVQPDLISTIRNFWPREGLIIRSWFFLSIRSPSNHTVWPAFIPPVTRVRLPAVEQSFLLGSSAWPKCFPRSPTNSLKCFQQALREYWENGRFCKRTQINKTEPFPHFWWKCLFSSTALH